MSTSLSSLTASIFPLCLQNKSKPLQENPLLSGPHPPVCLIHLYLLINPPTCSTLRSFRSQRNQGLLLFCLQAFRQVVLSATNTLLPFNSYTSFSSDILLPERLTWPPGYRSHLSPDWPVSYRSNIRLDSMEDGATLMIPWTVTCRPARLLCPLDFAGKNTDVCCWYWSVLPFSPPGELPDLGIKPRSPALQVDSLPTGPSGKPLNERYWFLFDLQSKL